MGAKIARLGITLDADRASAPTKAPRTLEAFSWGYAGWGPCTKESVTLLDAVERARGFASAPSRS